MPRLLANLTADSKRRVFTDADFARLETLADVTYFDNKTEPDTDYAALLQNADVLLTCWGSRPLTPETWAQTGRDTNGPKLLVAHAAGSVRGIVPKALLMHVRLTQGADAVAVAVAHYTVGLLLMALRQSVYRRDELRAGRPKPAAPYRDLTGLTVGIVGLSRVGSLVPALLAPFDCRVLAYDPYCSKEKAAALNVELADLDDLLTRCDAVSLHLPVTPETEGLINAARVESLQTGSVLINTSRSQVVDQDAVFARAARGEIEYYTDVTHPEPLPPDNAAWQSPHIFITPHIAGPTTQTLRRMALYAIDEVERFLKNEPLKYEVTADRYDLLA